MPTTATLSSKFQISIPKAVREELHWEAGQEFVFIPKGKALVVYEDPISWGFGAEIAARIADDLFEWLDAPVRRVAALDCQVGYAPSLEDAILPQVEDIREGIRELARY